MRSHDSRKVAGAGSGSGSVLWHHDLDDLSHDITAVAAGGIFEQIADLRLGVVRTAKSPIQLIRHDQYFGGCPIAQEAQPPTAGRTCQEAEALTGFQPVRDMVSERVSNANRDTLVRVPAGAP
jgi:hypothetical protein